MIKVGIIGCGRIADAHAEIIQSIPDCEIVGVCDSEELMAKQLCDRYDGKNYFSDVKDLLDKAQPDIVHITTPPQSHFHLGKLCLEAGCHTYVEKPFTLNAEEADELIRFSIKKDLNITVGHDYQFTHAARQMRKLIEDGFLGGPPIHMESYYCYDFGDATYAKALLGDQSHWVRLLPGKLLHNIISHGISKIVEFLPTDNPKVIAHGFVSDFLTKMNEVDIIDELRVIINDNGTTAYFTFSSQMRPALHHFRIYGPKNALMVDSDQQTLVKVRGTKYKSYLERFVPPYSYAKQYMGNCISNISRFLRADFHINSGMKFLINSFYRSVAGYEPLPISHREILLTAKIMDKIFAQLKQSD